MSLTLFNTPYLEQRLNDADSAEAQVDALVAQATRRSVAIARAVEGLRALQQLNREKTLTRAALDERLEEIATALARANKIRATDESDGRKETQDAERE